MVGANWTNRDRQGKAGQNHPKRGLDEMPAHPVAMLDPIGCQIVASRCDASRLDEAEKGTHNVRTLGGKQLMRCQTKKL